MELELLADIVCTLMIKLSELLNSLADVKATVNMEINSLHSKSYEVRKGGLFVALKGQQHHGVEFATEALNNGACAMICDNAETTPNPSPLPLIRVEHLKRKVGLVASRFYAHPTAKLNVIAITGTDGKTSVCNFLYQTLVYVHQPAAIIGTLGSGEPGKLEETTHTTPDCIALHRYMNRFHEEGKQHIAIEASSHGLDQDRLHALHINTAILTQMGHDHLDYHQNFSEYLYTKAKLFQFNTLRYAVINMDDKYWKTFANACHSRVKIITYSTHNRLADITLQNATFHATKTTLQVCAFAKQYTVHTALRGHYNIPNLLATWGGLVAAGLPHIQIPKALNATSPIQGRMEFFGGKGMPTAVIDYAHTPDGIASVLRSCRLYTKGNLICIFGCGGERDAQKRPLMGKIASELADRVVLTDDNPRREDSRQILADIMKGVQDPHKVTYQHDRRRAIQEEFSSAAEDDLLLIAGKGSEEYQLILGGKIPYSDRRTIMQCLTN